jgi:small nuclear ribonucleoprotein (snRNP)-like protein
MILENIQKNARIKVILKNYKIIRGCFVAYDKYMNLILSNAEEYQKKKEMKTWECREIGVCMIRGEMIIFITKEI